MNSDGLKVGIVTANDQFSQGTKIDKSGLLLISLIEALPAEVVAYKISGDDKESLKKTLCHMADLFLCDLILTTGGIGLGSHDYAPDATREIIDKEIPGIAEAMRAGTIKKSQFAMLSRGVAGVRGKTLMINFPENPGDVQEAFEVVQPILKPFVEMIRNSESRPRTTPEIAC